MAAAYPVVALVAHTSDPPRIQALADAVCDGTDDAATINTWITNVQSDGGGLVQLTDATFSIDTGPVKLKRKVDLAGSQWAATILQGGSATWSAFDTTSPGGIVEPVDGVQDRVGLRDLTIAGGAGTLKGLYARVTANTGFVYGDDSRWIIERVLVRSTRSHGFDLGGAFCREWEVDKAHVFDCGVAGVTTAHGFYWDGNDSMLRSIRCGAVTGEGIYVNGPNNTLVASKGYFADLNGIRVVGVRNKLVGCEAQDNLQNGLLVDTTAFHNVVEGFTADSNSYNGLGSGGADFYGIRVLAGASVVSGGVALDKNEGGRGLRQKYGWSLASGLTRCYLTGSANDNLTGMVQEEGALGTGNFARIVGSQGGSTGSYSLNP